MRIFCKYNRKNALLFGCLSPKHFASDENPTYLPCNRPKCFCGVVIHPMRDNALERKIASKLDFLAHLSKELVEPRLPDAILLA